MVDRLVDYSYNHPTPAAITAAGYRGVMRYLSFDGWPKNLTAPERDALHAQGLGIGLVWETVASAAMGGFERGVADAGHANTQASALGSPAQLPIFFAVDFEPSAQSLPTVVDYFRGVARALPRPAGAYGAYHVIEALHDDLAVSYFWQCVAWSHGKLSSHAHLFQRLGLVLGGTCDEDVALKPLDWLWYPPTTPGADGMALTPDVQDAFSTLARDTLSGFLANQGATADLFLTKLGQRDNADAVMAATAIIGHIDAQDPAAARKVAIDLCRRLAPPGQATPV